MWSAGTRDDTWKHAELSRTQGNEKYRPTRAVRTSAGSMKRDRILTRYYVQNIALEWNVTRDQDEKEHFPSKYFLHFSIWIVQNRDKFRFRAYSKWERGRLSKQPRINVPVRVPPTPTILSIPSGSVNWYQTRARMNGELSNGRPWHISVKAK